MLLNLHYIAWVETGGDEKYIVIAACSILIWHIQNIKVTYECTDNLMYVCRSVFAFAHLSLEL